MKRREFVQVLVGSVAVCPLVQTRAQSNLPAVGYLSSFSPESNQRFIEAFRESLGHSGFSVGRNVTIEYRWAEGQYDRLPALAAESVAVA